MHNATRFDRATCPRGVNTNAVPLDGRIFTFRLDGDFAGTFPNTQPKLHVWRHNIDRSAIKMTESLVGC